MIANRYVSAGWFLRIKLILVIYAASMLVIAGCTPGATIPSSTVPAAQISIQLSWVHTIEWAGFYIAEEKGYFADEHLGVTLMPGGFDAQENFVDPISAVQEGRADFGVINGIAILEARSKGAPLVAIGSIYQRLPLGFTSLAEQKIIKPQDLVGKRVQVTPTSAVWLRALLMSQGIDPAQVVTTERTDFTIAPLTSGVTDAMETFVTNELVTLQYDGHRFNNILVSDYGIEEYPNVIFTTEKMIAERPDVIERFLRAAIHGMQDAVADPESVAPLAVRRDTTLDLVRETESMFQSIPLLNPAGSQPGMMTDQVWESSYRVIRDQRILKQPIDLKAAYTLTFLEKIYSTPAEAAR